MQTLINARSMGVLAMLTKAINLGRTLTRRRNYLDFEPAKTSLVVGEVVNHDLIAP